MIVIFCPPCLAAPNCKLRVKSPRVASSTRRRMGGVQCLRVQCCGFLVWVDLCPC